MQVRSSGPGARSASTCPGITPAAKRRPSMICLIVGIGRLRVLECLTNANVEGPVPTLGGFIWHRNQQLVCGLFVLSCDLRTVDISLRGISLERSTPELDGPTEILRTVLLRRRTER